MQVESIKLLKPWEGEEYLLFHQGHGFCFHETRWKNGLICGQDFALLFNETAKVKKDTLLKVAELLLEAEKVNPDVKE